MRTQTVFILLVILCSCSQIQEEARVTADFNFNWKFSKGDFPGANMSSFDDTSWTPVRLPHDWSISEAFVNNVAVDDPEALPGGIGWYRKKFKLTAESSKKITWLEFDGVYNQSDVWINGQHLGNRPYGYAPFSYDLTPHLVYGDQENVIAVRVDRTSFMDSRWYSGSGIYRNVTLVTTSPVHIPQWGSFVTTPVITESEATLELFIDVVNAGTDESGLKLITSIIDPDQKTVARVESVFHLNASDTERVTQTLQVENPQLWDTENPTMYHAVHQIFKEGTLLDELETPFGIRSFRYDPETGFYLNGIRTPFKGVCLHHDGGSVGAAVPVGIWERRLKILKEAGCNAIRTSHNPPSGDFLDLCDRMGFLVQDEAFDEFHNPKDKRNNYKQLKEEDVTRGYASNFEIWAEADVKAMALRDRNHPSIVQWSIGNEIEWTYSRYGSSTGYWDRKNDVNYYYDEPPYSVEKMKELFNSQEPDPYPLAETAQKLADWIREVDPSRPVTANLVIPSVSFFSGYADALDIVGLSYRNIVYDYIHELYPEKMIFGTENWGSWYEWKPVTEREFIPGIFLWTGINYLGETSARRTRGSNSGLLDFAGFTKPRYHMFKTLWNDEPHIFLNTIELRKSVYQWDESLQKVVDKYEDGWKYYKWGWQPFNYHWNYQEGESIVVEVYSNQPVVELFLNEKSLGTKKLEDFEDHILKWMVPYEKGTLRAVSISDGRPAEYLLTTSEEPETILLSPDLPGIKADAYDVVHVTAQLFDSNGNPVLHTEKQVKFEVQGECRILGTDNGSNAARRDYTSLSLMTSNGKCLLILQSGKEKGVITVSASFENIKSNTIEVTMK